MTHKRPAMELLAPAGGVEAGLAALQYGADAVYLGPRRFSARADADNFSLEELDAFTAWAHSLRRRVFVTVNTLVLGAELPAMAELLGGLCDVGVDAAIVQDLGVARLARRHFPELELHSSTQLLAHDRAGVEALARLGFRRVTLARELTLEEIRDCASVPDTEVETFLHGALCYSYSGLCLFSSQLLGRSGNRGTCAYPCRDRWRVEGLREGEGGERLDEPAKSGFAFSMKDLALPDHVSALREAGVACLKIEGRKKSPLYVATTVDYYRRLIDGKIKPGERPRREADLQAVFSRPWTRLYLDSHQDKDVADRDFVGHRGAPIGVVESVVRVGREVCVRFTTARALARHDGLQIDIPGIDRPFGFAVTDLRPVPASKRERAESAVEVPAGAHVDVPLPDGYPTVPEGARLYCSSSQDVKARYRVESVNLKAQRGRLEVRLEARLDAAALVLGARVPARGVEAEHRVEGPFETAKDAAKMESAARAAFEKLGDTRFALAGWRWLNPEGRFVPVSRLNEARRALAEALEVAVRAGTKARVEVAVEECAGTGRPRPQGEGLQGAEAGWSIKVDRLASLAALRPEELASLEEVVVDVAREPLDGLVERVRAVAERTPVRLALPLVCRSWEDRALRAKVARLREAGFARWEASNVSAWSRLGVDPRAPGDALDLASDWPLYVLNGLAARQLAEMGVRRFVLSPEDGFANMRELLAEHGERATVVVFQDTPLFVSESCPYANLRGGCPGRARCRYESMELVSAHHGTRVLAINESCRALVVHDQPFAIAGYVQRLVEAGARHLRADFVHRAYAPEALADTLRRLRRGEPVPGHRANFERGLAAS